MLSTIPDTITHDQDSLQIIWKDGKKCNWNLLELRRYCPCAKCKGGHSTESIRTSDKIKVITLVSWKKVGRYALALNWSDGHDSGMYTYDNLRESCDKNSK